MKNKHSVYFPIKEAIELPKFTYHNYTNLDKYRKVHKTPRGGVYSRLSKLDWSYHAGNLMEYIEEIKGTYND